MKAALIKSDLPLLQIPALNISLDRRTFAVVLAGLCAFLDLYATQPILPMLAEIFHAGKVAVSMTVTAASLGVALAAPFIGRLADKTGRKKIIITAALMLAAATLLAATATGLKQLIFWRFIQGLIVPGISAITVTYINEEWPAQSVGHTMAAYVSGTVLGGFSGRILIGLLAAPFGWRNAFLILAVLHLIGGITLWQLLPGERGFRRSAAAVSSLDALRGHLRNGRLLAVCAVGFCVLFSLVATFTYLIFHLSAPPFLLSTSTLGMMFCVYLIGAVITPFSGRKIDKYGHRAGLVAAVAMVITGLLLTLAGSLIIIITGLALCATGTFIAQATSTSYIGVAARDHKALAVGLYITFYYLGGSAGAIVPGWLWEIGKWPGTVATIIIVQLITLAIVFTGWQGREKFSPENICAD